MHHFARASALVLVLLALHAAVCTTAPVEAHASSAATAPTSAGSSSPYLKKIMVQNAAENMALCNDGSPAGYYVRTNPQSTAWIVHLQGGFWCWDQGSCAYRAKTQPKLTSSLTWPSEMGMGGMFSTDPSINPRFNDVNVVYVPYCSSDSWTGSSTTPNEWGWLFQGRTTLRAIVHDLLTTQGMDSATGVLFSGCSAGGQGVITQMDYVATLLPPSITYRAFADAGWMLNSQPLNPQQTPLLQTINKDMWNGTFDESCENDHPGDTTLCFFSDIASPYLKSVHLVQASQVDLFQLPWNGVDLSHLPVTNNTQYQWARDFRSRMKNTMGPARSVFSPACISHCLSEDDRTFNKVTIDGKTLSDTLGDLFYSGTPAHHFDTCTSNRYLACTQNCPPPPTTMM